MQALLHGVMMRLGHEQRRRLLLLRLCLLRRRRSLGGRQARVMGLEQRVCSTCSRKCLRAHTWAAHSQSKQRSTAQAGLIKKEGKVKSAAPVKMNREHPGSEGYLWLEMLQAQLRQHGGGQAEEREPLGRACLHKQFTRHHQLTPSQPDSSTSNRSGDISGDKLWSGLSAHLHVRPDLLSSR